LRRRRWSSAAARPSVEAGFDVTKPLMYVADSRAMREAPVYCCCSCSGGCGGGDVLWLCVMEGETLVTEV
jgi:hypothetical protein